MTTEHEHKEMGPERPGVIFKSWQIFVFSLIPLALVFAGVIIGSFHGSDSELEDFSQQPAPAPATTPTRGPGSSIAEGSSPAAFSLVYEDGSPFLPATQARM
jgi:hypothetical protein